MREDKIDFEEYGIKFDKKEFKNMSKEDLKECEELLNKIENEINRK